MPSLHPALCVDRGACPFSDGRAGSWFESQHSTATDQSQPNVTKPEGRLAVQSQWGKSVSWSGVELGL
jgi:hypothetical protein